MVREADNTHSRETDTRPEDAHLGLGGELRSLLGSPQLSGNSSSVGRSPTRGNAIGSEEEEDEEQQEEDIRALFRRMKQEEAAMELRRKCPVPRPRGKIGELLGFGRDGRRQRVEDDDSDQRVR